METFPETLNKLLDELGDCLWYLAMISAELQTNLSTVAQRNMISSQLEKINNTLHGSGDKSLIPTSEFQEVPILLVGEAPGKTEEEEGAPFVGAIGQLLNDFLRLAI